MSERTDKDAFEDLRTRFEAFTSACAHDLRAPARNISALCELLVQSKAVERLEPRDVQLLDAVLSEGKRMTAVMDGVVEYARVPVRARGGAVDIARLVRAFWSVPEEGLTIGELPVVTGDARLLARLVELIVDNVKRFAGDAPPRLHVFGQTCDGFSELHFEDRGVGIPEGREELVFAVLRRCHPEGGVGAGLAICERIVAAHGGEIRVLHGRKDGATVIVRIPKHEDLK